MLSAGQWHKQVPKDHLGNLQFRLAINQAAAHDVRLQRGLIEMCKQDILFYINTFVWQYNPKKKGTAVGPFITWLFQDRTLLDRPETTKRRGILWCYENGKDAVIEKSREMGASWLFLIFQDWLCLFHDYTQVLNISKSAAAVDDKSPDSLFWKIRFMHEHLPDWLKGEIVEEKMYIGYKRTNSVATGEASTGRAGVGGRASAIFIDEFSQIKEDAEVRQRTAGTSDCRFFNGTHLGEGTEFYKLTEDDAFVKMQMHWTQHPDKNAGMYRRNPENNGTELLRYNGEKDEIEIVKTNRFDYDADPLFKFDLTGAPTGGPQPGVRSPWYDMRVKAIGSDRGAAMELDINARGSVSQFYNPLKIRELKRFTADPVWEGRLTYDMETGEPVEFVEVENGPIKLWVHLRDGRPPIGRYGAGCDVSGGSGATPSCLSIVNGATGQKVLEYQNAHIEPKAFAVLCVALCRMFRDEHGNGAKMAWETGGPGAVFGKKVWRELRYLNIFFKTAEHDQRETVSELPGWNPQGDNKRLLHEDYREALYTRKYLNPCWESLAETLRFKYTSDGSIEHVQFKVAGDDTASRQNHGDIVVADALGYKMVKGGPGARNTMKVVEKWNDPRTFEGRMAEHDRELQLAMAEEWE